MKSHRILLCIIFAGLAVAAWSQPHGPRIITFDVPGAGTSAGQGTLPIGIVQGNWIMGSYFDANNVSHGFIRTPWGMFVKFDAPDAGTNPGQGTYDVHGMNQSLEIVETVVDSNNVYHGFIRSPFGNFTTFDCPGAGSASYHGTAAHSVNDAGLVSAETVDANNVLHGCVRDREGNMTLYDPPDIGTGPYQGTYPAIFSGMTPEGAIVGGYLDANYVWHSYLRAPDGLITEFDDRFEGTGIGQGSGITGINPKGEMNGYYIDTDNVFHGFLRARNGSTTEYDIPGAGAGLYQGTNAAEYMPSFGGINPEGTITGFYADNNSVYHGFLRTAHGEITTFDISGAGTGNWQGTLPLNITPEGTVTGWYIDANGVYHGFLRLP